MMPTYQNQARSLGHKVAKKNPAKLGRVLMPSPADSQPAGEKELRDQALNLAAACATRWPNRRAVSRSPVNISAGEESEGDCAMAPANEPT